MKLPKDIVLDNSAIASNLVKFATRCGNVSGTAYRASGEYETDFDVVNAAKSDLVSSDGTPISMKIVQRETGCFDVLGRVSFIFDDGVFTVEAFGFDFWVDPDQIDEPVQIGDWVYLLIRNLTLFV